MVKANHALSNSALISLRAYLFRIHHCWDLTVTDLSQKEFCQILPIDCFCSLSTATRLYTGYCSGTCLCFRFFVSTIFFSRLALSDRPKFWAFSKKSIDLVKPFFT